LGTAGLAFAGAGAAVLLAALAIVALWKLPARAALPSAGLVTVEQSPYAEIGVVDMDEARCLVIDGAIHTMVVRDTWEPLHRYAAAAGVCKFLFESPGRLLVVGLGGGAIVKSYAKEGWQIDAVEIDPAVTRIARTYFGLGESEARVFEMDGRRFLSTRDETWDLIVLDAYGSSSIPFHLVTREAFGLVAQRLASGGVLAINVEAKGWDDVLVRALTVTLEQHFSTVVALPVSEPPNALGNLLVLAANRDLEFPEEKLPHPQDVEQDPSMHFAVVQMNHAWDNRFHPETRGVSVLTDDRNPVDIWAERINLAARKGLHRYWSQRGFEW
jgi:spermidine synthase